MRSLDGPGPFFKIKMERHSSEINFIDQVVNVNTRIRIVKAGIAIQPNDLTMDRELTLPTDLHFSEPHRLIPDLES